MYPNNKYLEYKQKYLDSKKQQTEQRYKESLNLEGQRYKASLNLEGQRYKESLNLEGGVRLGTDAIKKVLKVVKDTANKGKEAVKDTVIQGKEAVKETANKGKEIMPKIAIGAALATPIAYEALKNYSRNKLILLDNNSNSNKSLFENIKEFFENINIDTFYLFFSIFSKNNILIYYKNFKKSRLKFAKFLIKSNDYMFWVFALSNNVFGDAGNSNILVEDYSKLIHLVCQNKEISPIIVEYIIHKHKPNLNDKIKDGTTPIIFATKTGRSDIVKMLILHGADPNIIDNSGKNAYDYAKDIDNDIYKFLNIHYWVKKNVEIEGLLISLRIKTDNKITEFEKNVNDEKLNLFIGYIPKNNKPKIPSDQELKAMLELNIFDIKTMLNKNPNLNNKTALIAQSKYGNVESMKILLESNIFSPSILDYIKSSEKITYINDIDDEENNALLYAINEKNLEKVQLLMKHGAIPSKKELDLVNKFEKENKYIEIVKSVKKL